MEITILINNNQTHDVIRHAKSVEPSSQLIKEIEKLNNLIDFKEALNPKYAMKVYIDGYHLDATDIVISEALHMTCKEMKLAKSIEKKEGI